jgi:hypothetical protein
MRDFTEGSNTNYVDLPVPAAWLKWRRGDAKLVSIVKTDPGAYFGNFHAFLSHKDRNSDNQIENPKLPLPVVTRVSEDGSHQYQVYTTNVLNFLPLNFRLRYEYREKVKNEQGREVEKVVTSSPSHKPGYQPNKQIFGLVFDEKTDDYAPAILFVSNWSAFISLQKAADAWKKVKADEGMILIRRYGSIGVKSGKSVMPKFETFGQGRSTPIEAIGLDKPRFIADSPEFDKLFDESVAWKNDEKWNAEGKVEEEVPAGNQYLEEFARLADEAMLSNIEKAALVSDANGDYQKAIGLLNFGVDPEPSESDINAELASGDLHE